MFFFHEKDDLLETADEICSVWDFVCVRILIKLQGKTARGRVTFTWIRTDKGFAQKVIAECTSLELNRVNFAIIGHSECYLS